MEISSETAKVLEKAGLTVDENGLLEVNGDCLIDKRGVIIKSQMVFFPFDELSGNGKFKLQNGLWDKIAGFTPKGGYSCRVRVDLSKPLPPPTGFVKLGAFLLGLPFDQARLDNCVTSSYLVHQDEQWTQGRPPRSSIGLFPQDANVVVIYFEVMGSPDAEASFRTTFIHSEYEKSQKRFRHVDGAEKVYSKSCYDRRYESSPVKALHSDLDYRKIFRIDGPVSFAEWSGIVSAFFSGERLVKEILEKE